MGKFDSKLTEYLYDITMNGFHDEECGDVDTAGWYALITFDDDQKTIVNSLYRHGLAAVGAVVHVDSQGFVDSDLYTDLPALQRAWRWIEDFYAEGDSEGE